MPSAFDIGDRARAVLSESSAGVIHAVFDSSVYVESTTGQLACVLPCSAPPGPLHLRLTSPAFDFPRHVARGQPWYASQDRLTLGSLNVALAGARAWPNPDMRPRRDVRQRCHLCADARERLRGRSHALDAWLFGTASPEWPDRALDALGRLSAWCSAHGAQAAPDAALDILIGLGAGLTPAGDDVLGGLLLMAHLRIPDRLPDLVPAIAARLERTNPISKAHLETALAGAGAGPACLLAQRVASRQPVLTWMRPASQLGATSGWDMLAGMLLITHSIPH